MNKIPYVICSSDRYSDLWSIHLYQLGLFSDISNFDIYIICNRSTITPSDCTIINTGDDISWSNMLRIGLKSVPYSCILLTLDDFLIFNDVNTQAVRSAYNTISNSNNIDTIRLIPRPPGSCYYSDDYTKLNHDEKYIFSLQATFWKKEFLAAFLIGDFSPWAFEKLTPVRSSSNLHLCSKTDYLGYSHHSVQRGKWFPWVYYRLYKSKRELLYSNNRPVMNPFETLVWFIHKYLSRLKSLYSSLISN